jgi:hypothetical protein
MRKDIDAHLQAAFVLLEESLLFVMAFERFQYTRKSLGPKINEFVFQISRLRGDLLSVRELILLGQESSALAVTRVFLEDLELAMALAIEPKFAVDYGEAQDTNLFWAKNIGYGKINPLVERFVARGGSSSEESRNMLQHHRDLKTFLSGHIHPNHSTAFRLAFPSALENPGLLANRPLGFVGEDLWPLCLFVGDAIHMFSACCINIFIRPDPPPALADYDPSPELMEAVGHAHAVQEIVVDRLEELHDFHSRKRDLWKKSFKEEASET